MNDMVKPRKVQEVVKSGYERLQKFRKARAMFIREAVGQYYADEYGVTGEQPLNLIFSAIRAMIPVIVSRNPINQVETDILAYKQYAELLSLGIDKVERRCDVKNLIRRWAVAAMFMLGIMKVGIAATGDMIQLGDSLIDPGDIYMELVSFDDWVIDPICTNIRESSFVGHATYVPRQYLLDTDGLNHDLILELPTAADNTFDNNAVANLTRQRSGVYEMETVQDMVRVVELWVPGTNALVTIPDPHQITFDKYIGVREYYGPDSGPYEYLSFMPPIDDNPIPVAPVSLYFDLARAANRAFNKQLEKAEGQRDIVFYRPSHADVAQDVVESRDGDTIATDDPGAVHVASFGGKDRGTSEWLGELHYHFNYMAGNPDQIQGLKSDARSATQANILQSNAMIAVEDAKDILYDATARVGEKIMWYLHHDPLINMVLAKRGPGQETIEVRLTPEQRRGDAADFIVKVKPKSMGKLDPATRSKRIMEFTVNVIPAILNSAMVAMQMGVPFNVQSALTMVAEELEIGEWLQEIFHDPQYQEKLMTYMTLGGVQQGLGKGTPITQEGIMQQGGYPGKQLFETPIQEFRQQAQEGANMQQSLIQGLY